MNIRFVSLALACVLAPNALAGSAEEAELEAAISGLGETKPAATPARPAAAATPKAAPATTVTNDEDLSIDPELEAALLAPDADISEAEFAAADGNRELINLQIHTRVGDTVTTSNMVVAADRTTVLRQIARIASLALKITPTMVDATANTATVAQKGKGNRRAKSVRMAVELNRISSKRGGPSKMLARSSKVTQMGASTRVTTTTNSGQQVVVTVTPTLVRSR